MNISHHTNLFLLMLQVPSLLERIQFEREVEAVIAKEKSMEQKRMADV